MNKTRVKVRKRPVCSTWIKQRMWSEGCGMGEQYGYWYECAWCGHEVQGGYTECGYNFCPKCGADMRED
jgi:hypothetical protein